MKITKSEYEKLKSVLLPFGVKFVEHGVRSNKHFGGSQPFLLKVSCPAFLFDVDLICAEVEPEVEVEPFSKRLKKTSK